MCGTNDEYKRGKEMKLLVYTKFGPVPMVVNDDISDKELARQIQIALTTEQGNGKEKKEVQNGNIIKSW